MHFMTANTGARRRWPGRMRKMRRSRAHRSMSNDTEATQQWLKTHITRALERGGELESKGRRCGGGWDPRGLYRGPGEHRGGVTTDS
jgi:hypothetical protein